MKIETISCPQINCHGGKPMSSRTDQPGSASVHRMWQIGFRFAAVCVCLWRLPTADVRAAEPGPAPVDELARLQLGAAAGEARAQGILATLWWMGAVRDADKQTAIDLAGKSAAVDDPFGQFASARIRMDGSKGQSDAGAGQSATAFAGLASYAAQGDPWALLFRSELRRLGGGATADSGEAAALAKAVAANHDLPETIARFSAAKTRRMGVLILGDSMSLDGFGKQLDSRLRDDPHVGPVFTYMACGTNPLSWLRQGPFANVQTPCGFWTIEPGEDSASPREFQDTYETSGGQTPAPHTVPKIEDLLREKLPQIIIVQLSTNLAGLFPDGKTLDPERQRPLVRNHILPFLIKVLDSPAPLRRIYWIGSPVSGRISPEIQDFLYQEIRAAAGPVSTVVDSRTLIASPAQAMGADQEHYSREAMAAWADGVYEQITRDLVPLSALPAPHGKILDATPLRKMLRPAQRRERVRLRVKLEFKSRPFGQPQLQPYQEGLVSYRYHVEKVLSGTFTASALLVVHPSHIRRQPQNLDRYKLGGEYVLEVSPLAGSPWETVRSHDETDAPDLMPYIQVEDDARFPGAAGPASPP